MATMRCSGDTARETADVPFSTSGADSKESPGFRNSVALDDSQSSDQNEELRAQHDILQLARHHTAQSSGPQGSLFPTPSDASLDPSSPDFNARKWAKAFYRIRTDAADGGSLKTTGIAFKNLSVFGYGTSTDFQKTVGNAILDVVQVAKKMVGARQQRIDILHDVEGLLSSGEMLAVLGPPGSGCSTLLKTIAGDTHGFHVSDEATINYQGIHPRDLYSAFRGEAIYTAEIDDHFPHLTVGDTLYFAARARCPQTIPEGVSRRAYAEHLRDVTMAMFGILHTKDTRVGDDFVRGVSGGERKRVTIAEAALSYSPLQCWDNSTRGLDSANALEFCRTLRTQADVMGHTSCVAIYQASQDAYDVFDKVIVLYEGRQIFFGKTTEARAYFEALGFMCPEQQTTADFLTSMTSHQERLIRPGWEGKTPRSADDFARAWKASPQRAQLLGAIDAYQQEHPFRGAHQEAFAASRSSEKSASQRARSPFTLSYLEQVRLTLWRSWVLLLHDPSISMMLLMTNLFEGIVVSSLFFNLPPDASSMDRRALLLFFVVVINAFSSILEILTLYAKRRVVDKHARYALYHRSAEALSSMIMDLPYKVLNAVLLNLAVYFMTNLRREPGPFFFFLLVSFTMTLTMSMMFRLIASVTKSVSQALAPASIILLIIAMYAGFVVPPRYMLDWIGWVRWLNPVYYGLESVMLNEFVGLTFQCLDHIPSGPGYASVAPEARSCTVSGSKVGEEFVDGANYLSTVYGYTKSHRWRNFGVLIAYLILFLGLHLLAAEFIPSERSKGEVLVFSRKTLANRRGKGVSDDETGSVLGSQPRAIEDSGDAGGRMEKQTSVFHWKNVCYDVKVKGQDRRILDNVDGWVKPGTLTALMGASGAGKTTLLDVLATRVTMGVISGDMLVNGKPRDASFQRKTGYVQQQDLHLPTSTVREALNFSALLRQPARYSRKEKLDYVDTVIDLLGIGEYADAIVGVPGEGLNVEQRKRLTIGVELVARPELLLFLDEPTSGLDSQTSWSICNLMEKLTNSGQAVLCTIHQPSAMLFQRFDRLLLLARGGRTVYFGEIGRNSQTLVDYFVRNGAPPCLPGVNPAEYMLAAIGAAPGAHTEIDWPAVWRQTPEYQGVQDELARLASTSKTSASAENGTPALHTTFAAGYGVQFIEVTKRLFQQYWRSPSYIFSKGILTFGSALLIGLSFINANNTQRGLTSQMFGVFVFLLIFSQVVEQLMPLFVTQRTMYEARERPSRTYAWQAFLSANVVVEAAWNSLAAVLCFVCWYFPIGLYRNAYATDAVDSRGIAVFLQVWAFLMFTGTFGQMAIAALPNADIAGSVVNFFFIMMFTFTGILASPDEMPRFWIFMYRVNPFTYVVEGFLGSSLANASVRCSVDELVSFVAPAGQTCGRYMAEYIADHGGYLISPEAGDGDNCQYCPIGDTNAFLKKMSIDFGHRWRNFGLLWAYIIFNIAAAFFLYWLVRVPKTKKA